MRNNMLQQWGQVVQKLWASTGLVSGLRTVARQLDLAHVSNSLVVLVLTPALYSSLSTTISTNLSKLGGDLYPSSTGPISTTTKYINLLLIEAAGA